jgi:hypothetical protein
LFWEKFSSFKLILPAKCVSKSGLVKEANFEKISAKFTVERDKNDGVMGSISPKSKVQKTYIQTPLNKFLRS